MSHSAFDRAWDYFRLHPWVRWRIRLANLCIVLSQVALILLMVVLLDLLEHHGRIPSLAELPADQQVRFREEWNGLPMEERQEIGRHLGLLGEGTARAAPDAGLIDPGLFLQDPEKPIPLPAEFGDPSVTTGETTYLRSALVQELRYRGLTWKHLRELMGEAPAGEYQPALSTTEPLPVPVLGQGDPRGQGLAAFVLRQRKSWLGKGAALIGKRAPWLTSPPAGVDLNGRLLGTLTLLAVVLLAIRTLARLVVNRSATRITLEGVTRLRRALYHHATRLGSLTLRPDGVNEALGIFTSQVESIHDAAYLRLNNYRRQRWVIFGTVLLALAIEPMLAICGLILVTVVWVVGGQISIFYRDSGRLAAQRATRQLSLLEESMRMMRLVKGYLMEVFNQSRVERQLQDYSRAYEARYRGEEIARPLLVFLAGVALVMLGYVAGARVLGDQTGIARLLAVAIAFGSIFPPILASFAQRRVYRKGEEAAVELCEFLDRRSDQAQPIDASFLPAVAQSIEWVEIHLKDPDSSQPVLRGVSLTVKAGEKVGLVSSQPREANALMALLPKFFDPSGGVVRVDGRDLGWVTTDSLRAQVGIVFRDMLVFNDTVANNIGLGDAAYPLPRIVEAAKITHAHQAIQRLDYGYETRIGDFGRLLSAATQFRIALARALLRDPAVYLIEEPLEPLDEDSELLLRDTYWRILPRKTVLFHTHRESTLADCDRVVFIHDGRVEAVGTHAELVRNHSMYQHCLARLTQEVPVLVPPA